MNFSNSLRRANARGSYRKWKSRSVLQDAGAYQRLLDIAAQANAEGGVRQGLEDMRKGRVRPARAFFEAFEARHGISR